MMTPLRLVTRSLVLITLVALAHAAVAQKGTPRVRTIPGVLAPLVTFVQDMGDKALTPPVPGQEGALAPLPAEPAPAASPRLEGGPSEAADLSKKIRAHFDARPGRRLYVQVDKPMYRPGEAIWFKIWDLTARALEGGPMNAGVNMELVSPKGAVVMQKRVRQIGGMAANDFILPAGVQGGEYTLRARADHGAVEERPVLVSAFDPPRIKKKLEMQRKAYGPGDTATATLEIKRPTGEPLAAHAITVIAQVDGQEIHRATMTTNSEGGAIVRAKLPDEIQVGDGLLTVLVADGGVTESVSRRIPIVLKKLRLSFFPEGGAMVEGLPARVYFEARTPLDKPADVAGEVRDDHGNLVARMESVHFGMGRFALRPASGRRYHVQITKPEGIDEVFELPLAEAEGCVLRSYDDPDGQVEDLRVAVRCSEARDVIVTAVQREQGLDTARVHVPEGEAAIVYLKGGDAAANQRQGITRVTVFDDELQPLAERLIFRNRRAGLGIRVTADRPRYSPRDEVVLKVATFGPSGEPRAAEVAVAVVDDTVVSFADDKTAHILSRLLLEAELHDEVEEPNKYFDLSEDKGAEGLELLMGTRGWRRFDWRPVFAPPLPVTACATGAVMLGGVAGMKQVDDALLDGLADRGLRFEAEAEGAEVALAAKPMARRGPRQARPRPEKAAAKAFRPQLEVPADEPKAAAPPPAQARRKRKPKLPMAQPVELPAKDQAARAGDRAVVMARDEAWEGRGRGEVLREQRRIVGWAPVRVFPKPTHGGDPGARRDDFRDTVFWAPRVVTGEKGEASLRFHLSDAVTSFRVFSEGSGGGSLGRSETVFASSLPFSMHVKLPLEVSAGDEMILPLTLTNETDEPLDVEVMASLGTQIELAPGEGNQTISLAPRSRRSLRYQAKVTGTMGTSAVRVEARAGGLSDAFERALVVVPRGFPQEVSASGELKTTARHTLDLDGASPGSFEAELKLYASPLSTMQAGMEGMLRQPCGCFEQASSANYPNTMIMRYLKEHGVDDVKLWERSGAMLDAGYQKLTGYESKGRGYEWFGANPGHEALTAYGLMEFVDMQAVHQVDQAMVDRTASWLLARRDGQGGYERNKKALDSFGRASKEVTDAYITYALAEAGFAGRLPSEIAKQAALARDTRDPYLLALATNTLLATSSDSGRKAGRAAAARLAKLQADDGSWPGADHSITRSGGQNLAIETTSLALLALVTSDAHPGATRKAVSWLNTHRGGYGQWGTTQATVLGVKAMTAYAKASRRAPSPGSVIVELNGQVIDTLKYEAGRREPLVSQALARHLKPGENELVLKHDGEGALPYSLGVTYRAVQPDSSEACVVDLQTKMARHEIPMGETVRLTATVTNRSQAGQPMTLARVGLPGGLTFQNWQLKELRESGQVAFFETRAREVILYFRQMAPDQSREIGIDLVATVPGTYTAPASSAYLYYTDEHKTWQAPATVTVTHSN
jgi:alpha-2-macroglobulin-like protein